MLLAAALGFQDFRHLASSGVPLVVAGNGGNGISHAHLGHAIRAADGFSFAGVLVIGGPFQ